MSTMVAVTQEQFFAYVNPRDIVLSCHRDCTLWETRTRNVVGRTTPGYMCEGPKAYMLTEAAYKALQA